MNDECRMMDGCTFHHPSIQGFILKKKLMGWDADDLVDSQEAAEERREARLEDNNLVNQTQEGRAREARVASLRLSHTRVQNQLASATNAAHRQMLESALVSLDAQIKEAE